LEYPLDRDELYWTLRLNGGGGDITANHTINASCWEYAIDNDRTLEIQVKMNFTVESWFKCYDGAWIDMFRQDTHIMYDEGFWVLTQGG